MLYAHVLSDSDNIHAVKHNFNGSRSGTRVFLALASLLFVVVLACTPGSPAASSTVSETPENTPVPTAQPEKTAKSKPEATPVPTPTQLPVPPTATSVPPPPTPLPSPEPTQLPTTTPAPTATIPAPTAAPTAVPVPPTVTPVPTATPEPTVVLIPGTLPEGAISAFIETDTFDRNPTPTATAFPVVAGPFEEPTPTPTATGDLQPYFGNGQPIRVRNPKGGPLKEKGDLFVDFFLTNVGPGPINGDYFIDLYIDDVIAQRWSGLDMSVDQFIFIEGGTGLLDLFQLQPGEHTVKMVLDPTNLIPEISDGDNSYSATFNWEGPVIPTPLPTDRLPNLSLVGDFTGLRVAPFFGANSSGGLSVNGDTFITFSVLNDSPITVPHDFAVNLWFDDVLVFNAHYTGLIGGQYASLKWDGLSKAVRITPGEHTLRMVVDPTGAVTESDESDNTTEVVLVWSTDDPIPEPKADIPQGAPIRGTQVLSNLTGVLPYGWNAAISVSNTDDELPIGTDGHVWASQNTTVSFAVRNSSRVITAGTGTFEVQIYVDNEWFSTKLIDSGDDAGKVWTNSITIPANRLEPGQHLVRMVIDSRNDILESSTADNSVARWFEFLPGAPDAGDPEKFVLTDEELTEMLNPIVSSAFIDQVREADGSGLELPDWNADLLNAGRAVYYLLTGRDLEAERVAVHILPRTQFVNASFNACMTDFFLLSDNDYIAVYQFCDRFRGEIGFKYRLDGRIQVYVDLEESPIQALGTYFHELGHALQDLENPAQIEAEFSPLLRGLFEAEAQIFEAAALRTIEEFMGVKFMRYPDVPVMRESAEFLLDVTRRLDGSAEHVLGYTMLWHEVLVNTSGLNLGDELRTNKVLSATSAKALFDYLVSLDPADVESWNSEIFASSAAADEFVEISLSRLEADLATADYGNPGLQGAAFLAP
ncbi:hypothetical protein JYT27_00095 [bacterium AH-315-D21]|nr:hypothetical protein [bacterium AH-315-D21]